MTETKRSSTWLAVLALGLVACGGPGSIVIDNANILDGTGAAWPNGRLVVVDGVVTCLGAGADCAGPAGVDVMDADGFWVVPGLIDVMDAAGEQSDEQAAYLAFLLGVTTAAVPEVPAAPDGGPRPPTGSEDARIPAPRPAIPPDPALRPFGVFGDAIAATIPMATSGPPSRTPRDLRGLRAVSVGSGRPGSVAGLRARDGRPGPRVRAAVARAGALGRAVPAAARDEPPARTPDGDGADPGPPFCPAGRPRRQSNSMPRSTCCGISCGSFTRQAGPSLPPRMVRSRPVSRCTKRWTRWSRPGCSPEDALYAATREAARTLGLESSRGTLEPGKLGDFLIPRERSARRHLTHADGLAQSERGECCTIRPRCSTPCSTTRGAACRTTRSGSSWAAAMLLLTLFLFWRGVRRHRRSLGPRLL